MHHFIHLFLRCLKLNASLLEIGISLSILLLMKQPEVDCLNNLLIYVHWHSFPFLTSLAHVFLSQHHLQRFNLPGPLFVATLSIKYDYKYIHFNVETITYKIVKSHYPLSAITYFLGQLDYIRLQSYYKHFSAVMLRWT